MSVKKFKFVSPGVFLSEVDNSQLPANATELGPCILGRTEFGPAMRPVTVQSFSEFVETFGNPIAGNAGGDVWRDGNKQGPTYAAYAAQAYLKAGVGPVTMVRLLGSENPNYLGGSTPTDKGAAGWANLGNISGKDGGAYALVLIESGSNPASNLDASIAAVWYMNQGSISLSGTFAGPSGATKQTGSYALFKNAGTATTPEYTAIIHDPLGNVKHKTSFNLNRDSAKYIRNVFNTNPQLVNSSVVNSADLIQGENLYWLGESFEDHIDTKGWQNPDAMIIALGNGGGTVSRSDMRNSYANASTGWFIAQDVTNTTGSYSPYYQRQLFRVVARDAGENIQKNLKISIQNVKASTSLSDSYGSFDLVVRNAQDSDNVIRYIEKFTNLSLNPASENYIGSKIGDKYVEFDQDQSRLREYGEYDNKSNYIRVEVKDDIAAGTADPILLPFGVGGPEIPIWTTLTSGSLLPSPGVPGYNSIVVTGSLAAESKVEAATVSMYNAGGFTGHSMTVRWPQVTLRTSASAGGISNPTDAHFGAQAATLINTNGSVKADRGWGDFLTRFPSGLTSTLFPTWIFSLDDVVISSSATPTATAYYQLNARANGKSATARGDYTSILDAGYNNFTAPLYGGFDGLNITEIEPFRNSAILSTENEFTNYAYNTVKQALDSVADPEVVEYNLLTMPGLTNSSLTQQIMNVCEDRADSLAVIDLADVYTPFTENTQSFKERVSTPAAAITTLTSRQINSSYACTYYPWVQIRDSNSARPLWVPPSVIALGVMANSEAKSEVWFAPAGFNRGGLTEGSAGLPVTGVTYKLTSKERDSLYEASVNPIASFPSEGIVVFGQKTMQVERSALDRINVRRLMIYIKKQVSRISSTLLFDQNVSVTWDRFLNRVNPFLASIQSRLGLTEFRVVLDETTTTPDLVDQNIMYAKIFLKPARSIEFIAVDFVITRSGASFDD